MVKGYLCSDVCPIVTEIILYFFFFYLDRFKDIYNFLLGVYIYCLSCLLLSGDLKDGKNKADKKDQSNVGNDSKKTDGKSIIFISFFHKMCNLMQACESST